MHTSVILVNYKNSELTLCGLDKTRSILPPETEYIIVDNSESPCEASKLLVYAQSLPQLNIKVLVNSANLGFGHGCNLGASAATASILFFLNNDTWVHSSIGWDILIHEFSAGAHLGAISCRVQDLHGNDTPLWPARLSFWVLLIKIVRIGYLVNKLAQLPLVKCLIVKIVKLNSTVNTYFTPLSSDAPQLSAVDSIGGSAFLISKSTFFSVGGFDDRFFLYDEDTDLFERLSATGCQHYFFSGLVTRGYVSASTSRLPSVRLNRIKYNSRRLLLEKHFAGLQKHALVYLHRISYWLSNVCFSADEYSQ